MNLFLKKKKTVNVPFENNDNKGDEIQPPHNGDCCKAKPSPGNNPRLPTLNMPVIVVFDSTQR